MRGSVSQFVFGFVIAFSPAPFAGFGTYAYIQAQEVPAPLPEAEIYRAPEYGAPQVFDHEREVALPEAAPQAEMTILDGYDPPDRYMDEAPASESPARYEIETDCARRKRLSRENKQKKEPEIPEV